MQHPAELSNSMDCGRRGFGGPMDEVSEGLDGAAPVQRLTRPVVEQIGNRVQRDLVMKGQIGTLREHLPEQPVFWRDALRKAGLYMPRQSLFPLAFPRMTRSARNIRYCATKLK